MIPPFTPGRTQKIQVADTSVSLALSAEAPVARVLVVGNAVVFVRFSTGPATATAADYPVVPNLPEVLTKGVGADTISLISPGAGPEDVYVTTGWGQ